MKINFLVIISLLSVILLSCGREGPEPINFGTDLCTHCNMKIMDNRFGSEIVNPKGKAFKFDAAECMINYIKENNVSGGTKWVIDFSNPGMLVNADGSFFLVSPKLKSPMGENLSCYSKKSDAETAKNNLGGQLYSWNEIYNTLGK